MFATIIASARTTGMPLRLSSDHDPLFEYHRWKAKLRILDIEEIKTVPYVPLSHPFVERLIGTVRRELVDLVPFWNARDLERKPCGVRGVLQRIALTSGARRANARRIT